MNGYYIFYLFVSIEQVEDQKILFRYADLSVVMCFCSSFSLYGFDYFNDKLLVSFRRQKALKIYLYFSLPVSELAVRLWKHHEGSRATRI